MRGVGRGISSLCFFCITAALIVQTFMMNPLLIPVYQIVAPVFIGAIAGAGVGKKFMEMKQNGNNHNQEDKI